ncbi:PAS domain S-box/diguanylate cyclase (GGDEF) domain-containing protein [Pleurocapsa sp. PCC 7327]|uniref:GGDEF/EAL domain-containing response regulator n=1 Tax=Pleurocapsa sp. PCC 7327 TaxID=118163 RepID=UPI00029FC77E|nr:EAL domain-containing protein [Pleurocapsa sp. PCC 7327]AFY78331.1 PAS domain S-box/diguanylate cyclase (GGDEF) domain-containing protein [Pleurocapsa sp. PCC 7327]
MSKGAIVCVDDERFVLIALRDQLTSFLGNEHEILLAQSASEALEVFAELEKEQIPIPLIICDRIMPQMSGEKLLIEIHARYPKTRKILLTGQASFEEVIDAVNHADLYRYISKPWDETDLSLTVREAIRSYFQDRQVIEQNEALRKANEALQREIADRKQAQQLLQESEERLESILNSLEEVVWSIEPNPPKLLYLNPAAEKVYGRSVSEFFENIDLWLKVVHPDDRERIAQIPQMLLELGSMSIEYRILRPDGEVRWLSSRHRILYDANGVPVRTDGIIRDITQEKLAQERLLYEALHDALTGLSNRTLFMERVENALQRAKRHSDYLFAVLFIDLDRFKIINDSLGHQVGDQLIISTAQRLEALVRATDTIARLGGDEFVILLDAIEDINDAIRIAERISAKLREPLKLDGREVFTSASIGIALSSSNYHQASDLLRDADIAMYRAKAKGKSCYEVFDKEMYAQALAQLQLENDMRQALERNEFQVYYQPIVSTQTGKISGFEALIRWQHPTCGFVSPAEFIPLAEETGLIVPIGEWILGSVCQQIKRWQEQFSFKFPLKVSVNLSAKQFRDTDFLRKIDKILMQTGLEGGNLQLELTESMLIDDVENLIGILSQLRVRGIQLSIDDFGTGYSSLSYLHRFPVNYLKIDRSFVKGLGDNTESLKITESIVALAHNLKLAAIAEGVETKEQLMQLRQLGCEYVQGYLFSPPVPVPAATKLLAKLFNGAKATDRNGSGIMPLSNGRLYKD